MEGLTVETLLLLLAAAVVVLALVLARVLWLYHRLRVSFREDVLAGRKDAVQRSRSVTAGKVFEQLTPYLPHFPYDPREARFLGSPIDFVVFEGLDGDRVERVVFVEVKTGGSSLSARERRVRDAVREGRVEWREIRIDPAA